MYVFDLGASKVEKVSGSLLGHSEEKNLSQMFVSPSPLSQQYVGVACADSGYVLVLGSDSRKLLFDLKINGTCRGAAFSPDENYLYAVGDQADIY